jgi:hypothetical protein
VHRKQREVGVLEREKVALESENDLHFKKIGDDYYLHCNGGSTYLIN